MQNKTIYFSERERVINLRKDKSDINKNYLNKVVKVYMKILNTSYSSYREKCSKVPSMFV